MGTRTKAERERSRLGDRRTGAWLRQQVFEVTERFFGSQEERAIATERAFRAVTTGRRVICRHYEGGLDLFPRCMVTLSDGTRYLLHIDHPAMPRLKLNAPVAPGTVWARPWAPGFVMAKHRTES